MRFSLRSFPIVAVGAAVALAFACSNQKGQEGPPADCTDACVDGTSPDAGAIVSATGLDARPLGTTCKVQARPPLATNVALTNAFPALAPKFDLPVGIVSPPGQPDRYVVWEKGGGLKSFAKDAKAAADITTMITWPAGTINDASEGGLLGLAFHPQWPTVPEVYLSYTTFSATAPNGTNMKSVIARFQSKDGGKTLDPAADVLLSFDQPYDNHDGGGIVFGPDGYLYAGFGDGGSGGDPLGNGQKKDVLYGKILRLDVIGSAKGTYGIPPTNPFAKGGGRGEIYAYGFRNPWRFSFDRATGELWAGDVGQNTYEEIDKVVLGGNYGWSVREGFHCFKGDTCASAGLLDPVVEHPRSEARSITGGYVYRGKAMPSLVGTYVYGDYETGNVWALTYDAGGKATPKLIATVGEKLLASFGEDADGEILLARFDGTIAKLVAAGEAPKDTFPKLLSQTGCVDPSDPKKPAAGLIGYGVNSPLWSDGAEKHRYLALPDDAKITIGDDGDWDMPVGTVLVKSFLLGERFVETRLLMRHDDGGWGGYSYEWNEAQTDATLLPAGKVASVAGQTWAFPSRSQCQQCHTKAAGGSLGLETGQLNGNHTYPETGRLANQVATFAAIGLFANPPSGDAATLPCLAAPSGTESLEARARAYLHANCSHCHRPEGGGRGTMDLRASIAFAATKTCNEDQHEGQLGPAGAKLIVPGDLEKSVVALRFHARDGARMPPIGTAISDPTGGSVIDEWIRSLTGCP